LSKIYISGCEKFEQMSGLERDRRFLRQKPKDENALALGCFSKSICRFSPIVCRRSYYTNNSSSARTTPASFYAKLPEREACKRGLDERSPVNGLDARAGKEEKEQESLPRS